MVTDDLDAALDVRGRSFGPIGAGDVPTWKALNGRAIDDRRLLGAYDGDTVVAMARINRFRQWWVGRPIPMAGVGGVVVAPEHRGRGVGSALMGALIDRSRDLGFALSALYPATMAPYRAVGYEVAGRRHLLELQADALRRLRGPSVEVRRARPSDAQQVVDLLGDLYRRDCDAGPFDFEPVEWREELEDEEFYAYLAEDGFLGYGWDGSERLHVATIAAGSPDTLRSLWAIVASGSSVARTIRVSLSPTDPLRWLAGEGVMRLQEQQWWMLRLVDAVAAVEARGYPDGLTAEAPVRLTDGLVATNAGDFVLRVSGGRGTLVRSDGSSDALVLGPRGAAALFAGTPTSTLRRAALASGGSTGGDRSLDAIFAANPYMLDYF